ncbi:hypothetical protein NC652_018256 [Populus alba x Populus x berolinensis]|nr:hypothetical protein NC652_018256 [Populus alba x Populus x berolinensis]
MNACFKNFMTGYRVVFDREKLVLGWKKFDSMMWRIITIPTATTCFHVAAGLGSNSSAGSAKEASNKSPSSIASTYCYSLTSVFTSLISVFLICFLL